MIKKTIGLSVLSFSIPYFAYAAEIKNLRDLVVEIIRFINLLIPLVFGIAFLAFIWGVTTYIWSSNPQKIKEGRDYIIFSIIGFTVMLSVWGLAFLIKNTIFPSASVPTRQSTPVQGHGVDYYPRRPGDVQGPNLPIDPNGPVNS